MIAASSLLISWAVFLKSGLYFLSTGKWRPRHFFDNRNLLMIAKLVKKSLFLAGVLALAAPLVAGENFPESTKDGLKLKKQSRHGAVYVADDATLANYDKVKILDCFVQFEKDWQRNYNRDERDLSRRVTDKDVEQIKKKVAEAFPRAFSKELEKGGYSVVDGTGKDVLLIRPAIINLTVTAPETNSPGISETFVASNGSMTLYMELYDSATSTKIAEVMDAEAVGDTGFGHRGGRVSNQMEFDRTIQEWAHKLRKRLFLRNRFQQLVALSPRTCGGRAMSE